MKYQDCADAPQGNDGAEDGARASAALANANINPRTRLATDYLNHFNEAIMLLYMLSSAPECVSGDDLSRTFRRLAFQGSAAGDRPMTPRIHRCANASTWLPAP
jgi:hypothetical protein